jgi:beta-glucosidase
MMIWSCTWPTVALVSTLAALTGGAHAAGVPTLPYLDTSLPPQVRAADLVHRMTLQEKVSQLVNGARAIPRLGVSSYNWWSEALHGVAVNGTTEFPEPIGLGATFDAAGIHEMAHAIGIEGRVVHQQAVRAGGSTIFHGLDFWAPNINIFRDPRWGRGQETYGEDPFLTGHMGVAFVTGMQGSDPRYYLAIATPKHFVVHSGPEPTRHFADVDVSKHDMEDTYMPAFRAAIVEGHAGSIMCAYNGINGQPACANQFTLEHTLRGAWQFQGYVVSDCDAVRDIFNGHRYRPSQPQASAISLERGMDNECADFGEPTTDSDYEPFLTAVQQGYLSETAIDRALTRLFTARIRLGMFDPASVVPYDRIPASELDSPAHRRLALRLAEESMVLLKNDGVLPLRSVKRIAVVGPLADQTAVLLGNYNGIPTHTVSLLEGMKAAFPDVTITYVPGTQFLSNQGTLVPGSALTTLDGKPGLKAEYRTEVGMGMAAASPPLASRVEPTVDLNGKDLPAAVSGNAPFTVEWTGFIDPPRSGDYLIGVKADGYAQVTVGDVQLVRMYTVASNMSPIHLEKGHPVKLDVVYGRRDAKTEVQLIWAPVSNAPDPAAVAAARNADVVIADVGITSRLEGEEMPVHYPGFLGGDRTDLDIPQPEEALLRAVASAGKPLIVVLMNGSALAATWEKEHADAILEAWYPGEEGGAAIAATLSGKNNPAGRLPVTFYKDVNQLPNFEDYSMKGRTYRYFSGEPLWPFGYGLSYTTFKYGHLSLPKGSIEAGAPLDASVKVTNTGKTTGDEVVQLYLKFPDVAGAPMRALRGFQRIHLAAGETRVVRFHLQSRDLSMVTEMGDRIVAPGIYTVSVGGGQPGTGVPAVSGTFQVNGRVQLGE